MTIVALYLRKAPTEKSTMSTNTFSANLFFVRVLLNSCHFLSIKMKNGNNWEGKPQLRMKFSFPIEIFFGKEI